MSIHINNFPKQMAITLKLFSPIALSIATNFLFTSSSFTICSLANNLQLKTNTGCPPANIRLNKRTTSHKN